MKMREILFRGKRKCNGEWIEGGFHSRFGTDFIIGISKALRIDGTEVIPETVGQYTGLTDKNGKKIFEGDIVRNETSRVVYKVFYCVDSAMFVKEGVLRSSLGDTHHLEIIGNIHDNPELLGGNYCG
jgi:uncharacterized phage protein (TIGR01671 family)